jgi:hypothetical protein
MCTSTNKKLFVTTDNWQLQSPNAAGRQPLQRIERAVVDLVFFQNGYGYRVE